MKGKRCAAKINQFSQPSFERQLFCSSLTLRPFTVSISMFSEEDTFCILQQNYVCVFTLCTLVCFNFKCEGMSTHLVSFNKTMFRFQTVVEFFSLFACCSFQFQVRKNVAEFFSEEDTLQWNFIWVLKFAQTENCHLMFCQTHCHSSPPCPFQFQMWRNV